MLLSKLGPASTKAKLFIQPALGPDGLSSRFLVLPQSEAATKKHKRHQAFPMNCYKCALLSSVQREQHSAKVPFIPALTNDGIHSNCDKCVSCPGLRSAASTLFKTFLPVVCPLHYSAPHEKCCRDRQERSLRSPGMTPSLLVQIRSGPLGPEPNIQPKEQTNGKDHELY